MKKKKYNVAKLISSGIFGSIEKTGELVGNVFNYIQSSKLYAILADKLGINWFFERILNVDTLKVSKQVKKFKLKYPDASRKVLAQKLTKHKAFYTGSIGFVSGMVPGNVPALIFDFMTSTAAQAELIYEIAMVYDLDLEDPTRKGEVLTLMALGAGSSKTAEAALKLSMDISTRKFGHVMSEKMIKYFSVIVGEKIAKKSLAKLIPIAGGFIGATLNASVLYLTGKGAIAFYENLTTKNKLFEGELPPELKKVYDNVSIKVDDVDKIRDIAVIKVVIYILNMGNYSNDAMYNVIDKYFSEITGDAELKELIKNEVESPSYSSKLIDNMDKSTVSYLITESILCINTLGALNEDQKTYLKALATKYDLPFED